jgi:hypothetical protein
MLNICIFPRLLCITSTLTLASCAMNSVKPQSYRATAKNG